MTKPAARLGNKMQATGIGAIGPTARAGTPAKDVYWLVVLGLWLGTTSIAAVSSADSLLSFVSIRQGTASGIVDPREIVVQSDQEWHDLWKQHDPSGSRPPPLDFATEVAIGIFAGQQPTAGHDVRVVRVERGRAEISVIYQIRNPPEDALVAQVLTQPFQLIRVPRLNLPIQFKRL